MSHTRKAENETAELQPGPFGLKIESSSSSNATSSSLSSLSSSSSSATLQSSQSFFQATSSLTTSSTIASSSLSSSSALSQSSRFVFGESSSNILFEIREAIKKRDQELKQENISAASREDILQQYEKTTKPLITMWVNEMDKQRGEMGINEVHNELLSSIACANDVIMIWRPVNPAAVLKLGQGGSMGKAINTKGKSSTFNLISGDIPFDVSLSKLVLIADEKERRSKLHKYQDGNIHAIENGARQISSARARFAELQKSYDGSDEVLKKSLENSICDCIQKANSEKLSIIVDKMVKKDDKDSKDDKDHKESKDYKLYYLTDKDAATIFEKQHPIFLIQVDSQYYSYAEEKGFELCKKPLDSNQISKPVQIMAYLQWSWDKQNHKVVEKSFPITADYDELVTAPRKIYPLLNNREGISTKLTANLYKQLAQSQTASLTQSVNQITQRILDEETKEGKSTTKMIADRCCSDLLKVVGETQLKQRIEIAASLIFEYEQKVRKDHRDRPFRESFGSLNDWQLALKVIQKLDTEEATNHGPEVNNPFPEKMEDDDSFLVHLPDGSEETLKGEQAICNFINKQRAQGFPLDVNPKWGWERDEKRQLIIPKIKFDWEAVRMVIQVLQFDIESTEKQVKELERKENKETPSAKFVKIKEHYTQLLKQFTDNVDMIHLKSSIENLKLEPDIFYSETLDRYGSESNEVGEEKNFRLEVSEKVKALEILWRNEEIKRLEAALQIKQLKFLSDHKTADIISIQKIELDRKKLQPQQNKISSSTNTSGIKI